MDTKTLRSKTAAALAQELIDAQTRIQELRFKLASNQLKNVREIRALKRLVARIESVLAEQANRSHKTSSIL